MLLFYVYCISLLLLLVYDFIAVVNLVWSLAAWLCLEC